MSSVLSEYPGELPAPMVGQVKPTERRKISAVGTLRNQRNIQRDRHGTRTVSFVYTREQAAVFREWWIDLQQRGGGWFAADWPLPWSRGPNVFRFKEPPQWSLIGGRLDGQGYWQVSATCEIRGRGMLPTVEVMYLTSITYPIILTDSLGIESHSDIAARFMLHKADATDAAAISAGVEFAARNTVVAVFSGPDAIGVGANASFVAKLPLSNIVLDPDLARVSANVSLSARISLIKHTVKPDEITVSAGVTFNAS